MNPSIFPALANKRYFNYGGQGTMPQSALDAVANAYKLVQEKGPFSAAIFHWTLDELASTRRAIDAELGGGANCWALTSNVTEGCNMVMWGLDWQSGDHILLTDSEHNGVVAAAENLAKRQQLQVDYFAVAEKSDDEILDALRKAMTPRTKLVAYSHVLWNTGQLLPVREMVDIIAKAGAQSLVDGAQSAGVVSIDLSKTTIDYYCITGHKWMCGPEGVGALYIRSDRLTELHPTFVGWRTDMTAPPGGVDGSRFEVATTAIPLLAGFRSALAEHQSFGVSQAREEVILKKVRRLRDGLQSVPNMRIIAAQDVRSGLTSFAIEGAKHSKLVADLEADNFMVRTIPTPDCIRASIHYFTSDEDIDALVQRIRMQSD
jgi:L-cysteine/cystine lyase